jgi:hypothetical protein
MEGDQGESDAGNEPPRASSSDDEADREAVREADRLLRAAAGDPSEQLRRLIYG